MRVSGECWRPGVVFVVTCDTCERTWERDRQTVKPAALVRRPATCCGRPTRVRGFRPC